MSNHRWQRKTATLYWHKSDVSWCQYHKIIIYMQSLFSLKGLIFLHHNQLASNQTPLLLTNRHWLLLSCPYSSLKMRWRMKVATHFSLTSSFHEVHTDCNHSIRAVNRHMSWRMRISALFSWTCPSLEFTADLKMNLMTTMFMAMTRSKQGAEELSVSTVVKTLCTYSEFDLDRFLLEVFELIIYDSNS